MPGVVTLSAITNPLAYSAPSVAEISQQFRSVGFHCHANDHALHAASALQYAQQASQSEARSLARTVGLTGRWSWSARESTHPVVLISSLGSLGVHRAPRLSAVLFVPTPRSVHLSASTSQGSRWSG